MSSEVCKIEQIQMTTIATYNDTYNSFQYRHIIRTHAGGPTCVDISHKSAIIASKRAKNVSVDQLEQNALRRPPQSEDGRYLSTCTLSPTRDP